MQRRQIPFATAKALTATAHKTRKHIVERIYPNSFPRARNKRFASVVFRVRRATKTRLEAWVYDALGRDWLNLHIRGGVKTPRRSSTLAIPGPNIKRSASGRIAPTKRPRGLKNAFVGGEGDAIYQRYGRRQRLVRLMYNLSRSATIRRVFPFYVQGELKVREVFPREFDKAIHEALRTAR